MRNRGFAGSREAAAEIADAPHVTSACSRQESPRFAPRIAGRLELTDIAEEMPFEMRVLEAALDFVRFMSPFTDQLIGVSGNTYPLPLH